MSAPTLDTLTNQAVAQLNKTGAVRFSVGMNNGRMYYSGSEVGYEIVEKVKAAFTGTLHERHFYSNGSLVGEGYCQVGVCLTKDEKFEGTLEEYMRKYNQ